MLFRSRVGQGGLGVVLAEVELAALSASGALEHPGVDTRFSPGDRITARLTDPAGLRAVRYLVDPRLRIAVDDGAGRTPSVPVPTPLRPPTGPMRGGVRGRP